jgi:hypothetical protein
LTDDEQLEKSKPLTSTCAPVVNRNTVVGLVPPERMLPPLNFRAAPAPPLTIPWAAAENLNEQLTNTPPPPFPRFIRLLVPVELSLNVQESKTIGPVAVLVKLAVPVPDCATSKVMP